MHTRTSTVFCLLAATSGASTVSCGRDALYENPLEMGEVCEIDDECVTDLCTLIGEQEICTKRCIGTCEDGFGCYEGLCVPDDYCDDPDGDGYGGGPGCIGPDCDETRPDANVGALEICDGIDNNCNGIPDDVDLDGDTYFGCPGSVDRDCNDADPEIYPSHPELCNATDDNCNGLVDEEVKQVFFPDSDGDGRGQSSATVLECNPPAGFVSVGGDCNDYNAAIYPGAPERCNDIDDDCDALIDDDLPLIEVYPDLDGDGFPPQGLVPIELCKVPLGFTIARDVDGDGQKEWDCDASDFTAYPGAVELCDFKDNDCNDLVDEVDIDGDGYYGCPTVLDSDCDDEDPEVSPGVDEVCNDLDDNCDGRVDEGVLRHFYQDADQDGFGNSAVNIVACVASPGFVPSGGDCHDYNASIKPGAVEACNGVDDDCNALVDDGLPLASLYTDLDGDGHGATSGVMVRRCLPDIDGDGTADVPVGLALANDDCNDSNSAIHPGAVELCDGILNDCSRTVVDQTCSTVCPGSWPVDLGASDGHAVAVQLDGDAELEVVAIGSTVKVLAADGSLEWEYPEVLGRSWPSLSDIDRDGRLDIVVAVAGTTYAFRGSDGTVLASVPGGTETSSFGRVYSVDLDNDGYFDLVTYGNGGQARAIRFGASSSVVAIVPLTAAAPDFYSVGVPLLADLDGDKVVEISIGTGSWACSLGVNCRFRFNVYNPTGALINDPLFTFTVPFANSGVAGDSRTPRLVDADGDGVLEVLQPVADKSNVFSGTYVWTLSGATHPTVASPYAEGDDQSLFAPVNGDGSLTNGVLHHVDGPVIDIDDDGSFEEIVGGANGVSIYSHSQLLPGYPLGVRAASPVVADLQLDGRLDILYLGLDDAKLHCVRLGTDTWSQNRLLANGYAGLASGAFQTNAYDPYEPNDPGLPMGAAIPNPATLDSNGARAAYRAFPAKSFAVSAAGRINGILGARGDRDYFWGDGSGYFGATLTVPQWAPLDADVRVHFWNRTTGVYAGSLADTGMGDGFITCNAVNPCPTGNSPYRVVVEVAPHVTSQDYGPWPYRLTVLGL